MLDDCVAIGIDNFARQRAVQVAGSEDLQKARARLFEAELQRVTVERAHPLDDGVVVERLLLPQGSFAHLSRTDDLLLGKRRKARRFPARVEEALEGVDI